MAAGKEVVGDAGEDHWAVSRVWQLIGIWMPADRVVGLARPSSSIVFLQRRVNSELASTLGSEVRNSLMPRRVELTPELPGGALM